MSKRKKNYSGFADISLSEYEKSETPGSLGSGSVVMVLATKTDDLKWPHRTHRGEGASHLKHSVL